MLIHNAAVTGSLTLNGIDIGDITGSESSIASLNQATASLSSSIAILSGSFLTTSASYSSASGSLSTRVTTIEGKYATTGSNFFNGSQTVTGSLTVTNQIVAQTLNIQQVTSSTVYSSGSNVFGNSLSNTQQLTGSVSITGSLSINGTSAVVGTGTTNYIPKFTNGSAIGDSIINESSSTITINGTKRLFLRTNQSGIGGLLAGSALAVEGNFSIYSDSGVAGETLGIYYWNGSIYKSSLQVANVSSGNSNLILMKDGGNILVNSTSDNGNRLQVTGNGYFSGNVGINTTTLGERLNVNGGLGFQSSGTQNWHIYSNASNNLLFTRSGIADRMTLSSDGNLGLGVVPSAWASDWNVFQIGSISSLSQYNNNNSLLLSNNYYNSTIAGVGAKYIANGTAGVYQISGNNHYWYNAPSGTSGSAITLTQAMTLTASGRLLLGTTTEGTELLQVNGTAKFTGTGSYAIFSNTTATTGKDWRVSSGSDGNFYITHVGIIDALKITPTTGAATFSSSVTATGQIFNGGGLALPDTSGTSTANLMTRLRNTAGSGWCLDFGVNPYGTPSGWIQARDSSNYATNAALLLNPNGGNLLVGTSTDSGDRINLNGSIRIPSAYFFRYDGDVGLIGSGSSISGGTVSQLGVRAANDILFATNGANERMRIKSNGSVRYIPMATPASAEAGDVYYDSTSNKLRCYNGTSWNDLF